MNRNFLRFLFIDLQSAMIMMQIAVDAPAGSDKRARNLRNSRTAYETVLRFSGTVEADEEEVENLSTQLQQVRKRLEGLGEIWA